MYFYIFSKEKKYWLDFVVLVTIQNSEIKWWDLVILDSHIWLCIGKNISWSERYESRDFFVNIKKITKVLSLKAIKQINRLVSEYYTTYKKIIPLYLTNSFANYYKLRKSKKNNNIYYNEIFWSENTFKITESKINWQILILVPDFWTAKNIIATDIQDKLENQNISLWDSHKTDRQKIVLKNDIKNGKKNIFISTHSWIFCDWANLKVVYVVDAWKNYIDSQKDPRYKTLDFIKKLKELYSFELYFV